MDSRTEGNTGTGTTPHNIVDVSMEFVDPAIRLRIAEQRFLAASDAIIFDETGAALVPHDFISARDAYRRER